MCGVFGAIGPSVPSLYDKKNIIINNLKHRGPDGSSDYYDAANNIFLLHTRLSIIDLSDQALQPMKTLEGVLAFNGEIYNYKELIEEWKLKRDQLNSTSDTEVLLKGLDKFGAKAIEDLRGMFAGVYLNFGSKEVLLFRDTLGIKPLYYKVLPDKTLMFSSEIKTIVSCLQNLKLKIDNLTLTKYLKYENWEQGPSLIDDINILLPGEVKKLNLNTSQSESSIIKIKTKDLNNADLSVTIKQLVEDSVRKHLVSDVPLGVYLSGGVDSSLVATLASKEQKGLLGFTGYFAGLGEEFDETPLSELVANKNQIELIKVKITPEDFINNLDKLVFTLDEPRMGMGAFSQYMVAKEAAKHRKVILAGHGGDELFAGYKIFKGYWIQESLREGNFNHISQLQSIKIGEWPWIFFHFWNRFFYSESRFAPTLFSHLQIKGEDKFHSQVENGSSVELKKYFRDVYLPGLLLVEDKISMAHGLETRVPFCDIELFKSISELPLSKLMPNGKLKGLLKQTFQDLLPKEIIAAPKRGFPTPLRIWFKNELYDFAFERLTKSPYLEGLISKSKIENLLTSFKKYSLLTTFDEVRAHKIWMLLCLESWIRQYNIQLGDFRIE
jgi:asparagine synthase (glutamine-hydrolysing)